MLIMLMLVAIFVIASIHVKILHKHEYKCCIQVINYICVVITTIAIILASAQIVKANVFEEYFFTEKVYEKYKVVHNYDAYVFPEIAQVKKEKFNAELEAYKQLAESPWTNWFCNKQIAAMDYIKLEESK